MPSPYIFQSRDELITALVDPESRKSVDYFFARRYQSIGELVKQSVDRNTIRAFHVKKFDLAPLSSYRTWATKELSETRLEFLRISSREKHQRYLCERVERLEQHWRDATEGKYEIGFGRAAKLVNLSLKFLLLYSKITSLERRTIIPLLDIPLDSYTLQGVRLLLPHLKIRRHASMGFVKDKNQYYQIQDGIRALCAPDFNPIEYEILAWNRSHN